MSQILTLARKELRGYFLSPVALIFLGTFLFVVLFSFFWVDTFFRRNIADVRPLFHWLPVLLIFLVGALTMRLWSEEQRGGTLEILRTLPVSTHRLVLGKFLGGLGLIAIALALTLGLPLTVSLLGELDWGPVIGGYAGALLLAGAYLAIGLCISSSTDNPLVALIVTCVAGGALYLLGSDPIAGFAGNRGAELLHALGSGSRFESIQRGVIDLRDVVYYLSLTTGFLFLNGIILEAKRWSAGASTRPRRSALRWSVVLVLGNLVVLNVALSPVRAARLDLTQRNEYSISPVTERLLDGLQAPLLIRGYFSAKTHPLLAPLVPRIRDTIDEYGAVGGSKVVTEFIDPRKDPAAEKEANEDFGIKSVPFQFADRHEAAVVNSYFHVVIKYGDKYEKLSFEDLIEVKATGFDDIEVRLRNLEYDMTRAIKKVVYGFQPLEELFNRVGGKVTLTAYVTPKTLPENFAELPARIKTAAEEIAKRSAGKFAFEVVDPHAKGNEALPRELFEKYGFKPLAASLLGEDVFYLHMLLSVGDKHERLLPPPQASAAELRTELEAALKRLTPGFLKTVGLLAAKEQAQPPNPMMGRQPPPRDHFRMLRAKLGDNYTVKDVQLGDGRVPGEVDVLLVAGTQELDDKQRFAVDQFLMRGGSVVVLGGRFGMEASRGGGLTVRKEESKLFDLLESWGIEVQPKLVLDPQNEAFPVPVARNVMGMSVQEIQMLPYPFWVDVRSSGMADGHATVAGLPSVTLQWASPIDVSDKQGVQVTKLLQSSDKSWVQEGTDVQPDFERYPERGFKVPAAGGKGDDKLGQRVLAVAATGRFVSAFAGQASPLLAASKDAAGNKSNDDNAAKSDENGQAKRAKRTGQAIERAPQTARLAVVGSSEFVNDQVLALSRQGGSDRFTSNLQLVENLIDWSLADVELLQIRGRGAYARTLKPMDEGTRSMWEIVNYGGVVLLLGLIVGVVYARRRSLQPMELTNGKEQGGGR